MKKNKGWEGESKRHREARLKGLAKNREKSKKKLNKKKDDRERYEIRCEELERKKYLIEKHRDTLESAMLYWIRGKQTRYITNNANINKEDAIEVKKEDYSSLDRDFFITYFSFGGNDYTLVNAPVFLGEWGEEETKVLFRGNISYPEVCHMWKRIIETHVDIKSTELGAIGDIIRSTWNPKEKTEVRRERIIKLMPTMRDMSKKEWYRQAGRAMIVLRDKNVLKKDIYEKASGDATYFFSIS